MARMRTYNYLGLCALLRRAAVDIMTFQTQLASANAELKILKQKLWIYELYSEGFRSRPRQKRGV